MVLSLDTHVLLWWLADDAALPQTVRAAISDGRNLVFVSAAGNDSSCPSRCKSPASSQRPF